MILFPATTDKLSLITSAAGDIDVVVSYADMNSSFALSGLGRQVTNITTAATTDILAAPGASTTRNMKQLTARNVHATIANDLTVQYNANGTLYELHKVTLQPGDCLQFVEGVGFFVLTNISGSRLLTSVEPSISQNVFACPLARSTQATGTTTGATAYAVYMGRTTQQITAAFVEFHVTTAGAGAQTAEVGIFSSPSAPFKSNQTLTKIVATGTVDSLTSTGMKRNTSNFSQAIPAGTHLWAVYRVDMATTEPTVTWLLADQSQGHVMTLAAASALTGISTLATTIPAIGTGNLAPDLRLVLN